MWSICMWYILVQTIAASGLFRCKWSLHVVAASGFLQVSDFPANELLQVAAASGIAAGG